MNGNGVEIRPDGYHIGCLAFAFRLGWFTVRHLVPRYGLAFLPLLVPVAVCYWLSAERMADEWMILPPLGVFLFGGVGLFAARTTVRDLLVEELVSRDLLVGRTGSRKLGAVHGSIRALETPLVSPLSGRECVAYEYVVSVPDWGDSATGYQAAYVGYHFVPTEIVGSEGNYRLLAFPDLRRFESESASRSRAREHVGQLSARPGIPIIDRWLTEDRLRRETCERFAADLELKRIDDWKESMVDENALPEGSRVCVIGYVDDHERVVRPPFPSTGHRAWVYPGSPQVVVATLEDESGVGAGCAVVFLALGLAAFMFPVSPLLALSCGALFLLFLRWPRGVLSILSKFRRRFRWE